MVSSPDLLPAATTVAFARGLARHGDRTALITVDGALSYRDLAARVADTAGRLGPARRLVLLAGANTTDAVVVYLAALAAGHPLLLAPGERAGAVEALVAAYDPDIVVRPDGGRSLIDERRPESAHTLHPDLALLLSTSGSTGSPKLVRLSQANLQANAASIADYLDIRGSDRAATTLPMHYCYGLSVINSHLLRGAGLILTDLSVADSCFWDLFRTSHGTSFAGVPYTFDLLDRVGFADMRLPQLRYLTQAGGRLAPDRVARYAALGKRRGWQLFVMYGQTEATARMAYLPPHLAEARPQAIGIPIPGGSFRLQPLPDRPDPDVGELVYTGPNVMLGYAEAPADLALGRAIEELHTGDLARRGSDGLYELVGRRSRFAKILGLRVDPHQVQTMLDTHGISGCCLGGDDELLVAVTGGTAAEHVRRLVAGECGLPARAVRVCHLAELPRLASGKPDHQAVRDLTRPAAAPPAAADPPAPDDLRRLYAQVLDRAEVTEDSSFVSLGGDSLTYVEMSLRLEQALGHLPPSWHTTPIRQLRHAKRPPANRARRLDTSAALRAISIVLIVGTHAGLFGLAGGAHLLLGVAGYNFARFHLTAADRRQRARRLSASIARIAVPSMAWITAMVLLTDDYRLSNIALLNTVLGPRQWPEKDFWFIEALVYTLLALVAAVRIRGVDRLERRFTFALPMTLAALAVIASYDLVVTHTGAALPTPIRAFWLFALGWATAKATTAWHRVLVTAAVLATVPGFFADPAREAVVIAGLCLLVWVPTVPSLTPLNRLAGALAGASLYIYLTHWQVHRPLADDSPLLALVASLAAGLAYAAISTSAIRRLAPWRRSHAAKARPRRSTSSYQAAAHR
jgi:acyl-CoA synthetase (AMP-forming)/AMP-acid ligase II/fucose 4-O-acetylase-like acetyltransferase